MIFIREVQPVRESISARVCCHLGQCPEVCYSVTSVVSVWEKGAAGRVCVGGAEGGSATGVNPSLATFVGPSRRNGDDDNIIWDIQ